MKSKYITLSLVALLMACSTSDVEEKKKELLAARDELAKAKTVVDEHKKKIEAIEDELKEMDPEFAKLMDKSVSVTAMVASPSEFEHRIEVRGNIDSRKNVNITPEMGGTINRILVKAGDRVSQGQTLAVLDGDIIANNIAELKTSLELATAVYEKQERLWNQKIGTELQYLEAKNNKETLEKKLATTRSQQAQLYVKSPFTGTVDEVFMNEGEMASPTSPLVRVTSPQGMFIQADISERFIGKLNRNDKVWVYFPVQDTTLQSTISAVSQTINPENRTFEVEVNIPSSKLVIKPNQVAVIHFRDYYNEKAYVVDTKMIQADEKGHFLFQIVDSDNDSKKEAKKIYVKAGVTYRGKTEVVKGLEGGEQLVDRGFRELSDGTEVKIYNEKQEEVAKN